MAKSLLEQLPDIVTRGRQVAERILESLEGRHRVGLQTREWVLPARDSAATDWIRSEAQRDALDAGTADWVNRLIYGDNLLAMAALLAGDEASGLPSLRGKIDLIYIDPPFDSKADYRTKVTLPGVELEQRPTVIEQFAYSDTWADGTASYLAMIVPRLILMRELLADTGSIYVHLDWHVGHYVKVVADEIFGKQNFINEIIWHYRKWSTKSKNFQRNHDTLFWYGKDAELRHFEVVEFQDQSEGTLKRWKGKKQLAVFDESGKRTAASVEDDTTGAPLADVWAVSIINPAAKERLDYSTQKPEQLLNRIRPRRRLLRRLRHHRRRRRKTRPPLDHHRPRQARLHDHAQAPDRPEREALPLPGHRRLSGRGGERRRSGATSASAIWRRSCCRCTARCPCRRKKRPLRNLGQHRGGGRQDAGVGRFAEQAHRRGDAEKGGRPARQPDGRLGQGGGAGLELRAGASARSIAALNDSASKCW
jgi:DNA modification methylase